EPGRSSGSDWPRWKPASPDRRNWLRRRPSPTTCMDPDVTDAARPLSALERVGLALLALLVVAFGGLTVLRSAFQHERKTDFGVYARAGYAIRTGLDPYDKAVCDDRGWHYCYAPAVVRL